MSVEFLVDPELIKDPNGHIYAEILNIETSDRWKIKDKFIKGKKICI
jgi:hypothetical protein